MDNNDFGIFKQEISWLFKPTDKIELIRSKLNFSDSFISTFPTLYKLLSQASTIDITSTRKNDITCYKLFSWTNSGNLKSGWLCKAETDDSNIEILSEHQLLLDNIGGIQESYKQLDTDKEMLTDNQRFLFIKSDCHIGLGSWIEYYDQVCDDENARQIDTKDLICFVSEANGNETFYDLKTKKVLLFATDHSFENVEILHGQPAYTFYSINGVMTFVDYVETLAKQWTEHILLLDN